MWLVSSGRLDVCIRAPSLCLTHTFPHKSKQHNSATDRELNAIESENAKNLQSDGFRAYQLEKGRANPAHPFSKVIDSYCVYMYVYVCESEKCVGA